MKTISILLLKKYEDEILNKNISIYNIDINGVVDRIENSKKNNNSKNIVIKEALFSPFSILGIYKGNKNIEKNKRYIFNGNISTFNNKIYFFINNIKEIE